ncbi:MAG: hypothetical protein KC912_15245 [Proteobacteria bacterium]|nr:hypothetical protein [Pseudomonadota bacterium]
MEAQLRPLLPLILALTACQRNVETPFPEGLEPLEEMAVEAPVGTVGDPFPETTTFVVGDDTENDWVWAHVRGYIHADAEDVWDLMRDDGYMMADRRGVDAIDTTYDVEPDLCLTFVNHVTVNDIITLEWDITYRGDVAAGNKETPERFAIRFQKTEGSSLIDLQEGSIVLNVIEDGITEFQFIERLRAPQTSTDDPLAYGQDMHESLVALAAGGELPDFTE